MKTTRIQAALILCLLSIAAPAQTARKSAPKSLPAEYKLSSIHVTGTQRYTPQEIVAATGLEIGSTVTQEDFQKAGQKLGECGLFSNVSYGYAFSPAGTRLDLELADTDRLVPVRFENFVWYSNDELMARIRERVPLFKGEVPIGGNLADQISDVLQALLVQHNLLARADYIRDSKEPGGPIDAISFRATGVTLEIRDVHFEGAGTDETPALTAAAAQLEGRTYSRSEVQAYVGAKLLPVYQEHGYLNALISEPEVKVAEEKDNATLVSVGFSVKPGSQYKISEVDWQGNKAFPAEKLQGLIHAKSGEIANAPQLQTDLEGVRRLYGTAGYMTASVKATPRTDDATRTVAYLLEVHEGEVFHLGDLDFQGVDPKTVDRLREAWTLRETDPYDSSYPMRFFEQTVKLLSHDVTWTVSIHEGVNEQEKTVDVTLRYGLKPSS